MSAAAAVVISNGVVVARLWARDTGTQHLDRNFPFLPVSICTTFGNSCRNEGKQQWHHKYTTRIVYEVKSPLPYFKSTFGQGPIELSTANMSHPSLRELLTLFV